MVSRKLQVAGMQVKQTYTVRKPFSTIWYFLWAYFYCTKYRKMYSRNWAPNMKIFPNQIHFWLEEQGQISQTDQS